MRNRRAGVLVGVSVGVVLALGPALVGQDEESGDRAGVAPAFDMSSVDPAKQMASMGVRKQHEMLEFFVGEWVTTTKMLAPGRQVPDSSGKASGARILGGRFLEIEASGMFMGMAAEARIIIGFDTHENRYDMMVLNNMTTAMYSAAGLATVEGDSIVFYGNMAEPALGLHDREVKYIVRRLGTDEWAFEVYDLHIGEEGLKVVETLYKRAG